MKPDETKAIENATNGLNSALLQLPKEHENLRRLVDSLKKAEKEGEALDDVASEIRKSAARIEMLAAEIRTFDKRLWRNTG